MADQATPPSPVPEMNPTPAPAPTSQQAPGGVPVADNDEKFFAALGYLAFLFVIPLVVKPKSAYCKFHAKQSMVLFLITIVVLVFLAAIPSFGSLLTLALFAVYVLAMYRAYKGELWNIPGVSLLAGKMNVDALYGKAGLAVSSLSGLKESAENLAGKAGEAAKSLGNQEQKTTPQSTPQPSPTPPQASGTPPPPPEPPVPPPQPQTPPPEEPKK